MRGARGAPETLEIICFSNVALGRPPDAAPDQETGTPKTLEKHWKMMVFLVPGNRGPWGPPAGPPRHRPRNPREPCKTIGKTMGSRGIGLANGGRPPPARAGFLDRERVPQKPLKPMGNSIFPGCSKWVAPAEGFSDTITGCARSHENYWKPLGNAWFPQ